MSTKLTERQKKNIIAAYAAGGVSCAELAKRYKVHTATVYRAIQKDGGEFAKKCEEEKIKAETSMREFFSDRRDKAQSLIDVLLDLSPAEIRKASLRDRMGALKMLHDCFIDSDSVSDGAGSVEVHINLADTSGTDTEGEGGTG